VMHGQRPRHDGCRPPWLPEPYFTLWRSSSTQSEMDAAAGSRSPPVATEQQRKQLCSMLVDSFQTDPKGTSELLARTLDGRTQRVLLAAFAEQPALSRWVGCCSSGSLHASRAALFQSRQIQATNPGHTQQANVTCPCAAIGASPRRVCGCSPITAVTCQQQRVVSLLQSLHCLRDTKTPTFCCPLFLHSLMTMQAPSGAS
jgi:hypothetical protein